MFDFLDQSKKEILKRIPSIQDIIDGTSREEDKANLIRIFDSALRELGFTKQEINLMINELDTEIPQTPKIKEFPKSRIKVIEKPRIKVIEPKQKTSGTNKINPQQKKDVDSFVNDARNLVYQAMTQGKIPRRSNFLASPANTWLMDNELQFLCARLGVQRVAFLYDQSRQHYLFITKVDRVIRLYDPMDSAMQTKSTIQVIQDEKTMRGDRAILSPDLEQEYFIMRASKTPPYYRINFLADVAYESNEQFIKKIGRIQRNVYDCGPLVVYAALQSKRS